MKKAKKILLLAGAYILTAALAIGGTVAYLQHEDSDVNVMTLGNVTIEQLEYERVDGTKGELTDNLKEFQQKKGAYPYTGSVDANGHSNGGYDFPAVKWNDESAPTLKLFTTANNVVDKFITVKNTGKSDAYVRTILAFEEGSDMNKLVSISANVNSVDWNWNWLAQYINVDGSNYSVAEVVYKTDLKAGDETLPNLLQVYLNAYATNEDMKLLGETWDVLAISQAVQTAGFSDAQTALDTAFGDVTAAKAAEWFGGLFEEPLALVTVLDKNDTITNADGDVVVLGQNLTIDTTDSKMGLDLGSFSLDTAYQFEPYMSAEEVKNSEYKDWHADFVVKVDKDIPAFGVGLAGYYDAWCSLNNDKWVMLASDAPIDAGTEIRLVQALAEMSGWNITVAYKDICEYGNDGIGFLCGAVDLSGEEVFGNTVEPIPAGTTITVELRLYEATDSTAASETGKYITTGVYSYTF